MIVEASGLYFYHWAAAIWTKITYLFTPIIRSSAVFCSAANKTLKPEELVIFSVLTHTIQSDEPFKVRCDISGPHGDEYEDVFWDVARCSLIDVYCSSETSRQFLPDYTA